MSENIRGITFAEQSVTPADDAIVRRAVLGDGILTGCEISYSGSTLTLAPGYIIACGRSFQITTAQNWAVVDATSGFARLLLTLDLTKTATENAFNQIDFAVEYASAEDGFADLVQEDINISGTRYQIVAAEVSLGTGGITGIVSKLEQAEGGGAGINFDVVAYASETALKAATPKENTIGIVTTTAINGWAFYAEEPTSYASGMVWIKVGNSSEVAFNALKKNDLQVYPIAAYQRSGSSWVQRTAYSYQGGAWNSWWNGELYVDGDEYVDVTGGWEAYALRYASSAASATLTPIITKQADGSMKITYYDTPATSGAGGGIVRTKKKINLSDFSALEFTGYMYNTASIYISLCIWSEIGTYQIDNIVAKISGTTSKSVITFDDLDISNLTGEYYIGFTMYMNTAGAEVLMQKLRLKR